MRQYWLLDGRTRTYHIKEEIKKHKGKWNELFGCWEITADDDTINMFELAGIKPQLKITKGHQNVS